jgi:hypothetical protein
MHLALGEAAGRGGRLPHKGKDTIGSVGRLSQLLRNPFTFLFTPSSATERITGYVLREHERGRSLAEIMEDPYVRNRLTPQERERLLDRPEIIRAVGDDVARAAKAELTSP